MPQGSITGYIDVAQLTLYAFWIFFAFLILYLRREDRREGYPLLSDKGLPVKVRGIPLRSAPKMFRLQHGSYVLDRPEREVAAIPTAPWAGAPLEPTGNPLVDGVGAAAYADRADVPELTYDDGVPKIVPLRVATDFVIASEDANPVGMKVVATDGVVVGTIADAWVDRSEYILRYLEAAITTATGPRHILIPMNLLQISAETRRVRVRSLTGAQFALVPTLAHPDQVTLLEEDKVMAYFGGGSLYATASRLGPIL